MLPNFWSNKTKAKKLLKEKKLFEDLVQSYKVSLKQFDEILLIGSGKGVVSTSYIVDSNWKRRKNKIFNSMYKTFEKEFKKQKYIYN